MKQATKLNEVRYDIFEEYVCWFGSPAIVIRYNGDFYTLPKGLEFNGRKYAMVSYNSDTLTACYSVHAYNRQAKELK